MAYAVRIEVPTDADVGEAGETVTLSVDESQSVLSVARRYYDVDREVDFVLLCTAKPRSVLRLQAFAHDAMLDHRAAHDLPPGTSKR